MADIEGRGVKQHPATDFLFRIERAFQERGSAFLVCVRHNDIRPRRVRLDFPVAPHRRRHKAARAKIDTLRLVPFAERRDDRVLIAGNVPSDPVGRLAVDDLAPLPGQQALGGLVSVVGIAVHLLAAGNDRQTATVADVLL